MTNKKYVFKQKRINNVEWSDVSKLSSSPSLSNHSKSLPLKTPFFYLTTVSINHYEDDIYFVNNTDQTLSFVAPFSLYRNINETRVKLGNVSDRNLKNAKLYADNMDRLYTNVLPNQAVRIGSTHIMYDSDGLTQWLIHVPFKGVDTHYGIWRLNAVEKGGIGGNYPLLWNDFSKPSHMVSCDCVSERGEMPIEPSLYEERCWVFEQFIESLGVVDALFVLAINDVLYRYCIGWSAPYNESDIQAKEIAHKLQELKPNDAEAVKNIVQAVYDFWFDEGFAKDISIEACAEILDFYKQYSANH